MLLKEGGAGRKDSSAVSKAAEGVYEVGKSEDVKAALEAAGGGDVVSRWEPTRNEREHQDAMEM